MPATRPRKVTPVGNDLKIGLIPDKGNLIMEVNADLSRFPYHVFESTGPDFTEVLVPRQGSTCRCDKLEIGRVKRSCRAKIAIHQRTKARTFQIANSIRLDIRGHFFGIVHRLLR
jgi:hypothetical protein